MLPGSGRASAPVHHGGPPEPRYGPLTAQVLTPRQPRPRRGMLKGSRDPLPGEERVGERERQRPALASLRGLSLMAPGRALVRAFLFLRRGPLSCRSVGNYPTRKQGACPRSYGVGL